MTTPDGGTMAKPVVGDFGRGPADRLPRCVENS
jgi:hypothetical protein